MKNNSNKSENSSKIVDWLFKALKYTFQCSNFVCVGKQRIFVGKMFLHSIYATRNEPNNTLPFMWQT